MVAALHILRTPDIMQSPRIGVSPMQSCHMALQELCVRARKHPGSHGLLPSKGPPHTRASIAAMRRAAADAQ